MDLFGVLEESVKTGIGTQAAVFALAGVGLNLQFGHAGLLNFGHVAFMLAGGYGAAITVDSGAPTWAGVLVGLTAAVVVGLLLGLPSLRLRADYLAIVTIAAAEMLRLMVRSDSTASITNGVYGIQDFADGFLDANPISQGEYGIGSLTFDAPTLWLMLWGWGLVAVFSLLIWALMRSPWGRVLRSIREDEDAARSLGKNVFRFKLQTLVLGGIIAALAGMLRAAEFNHVQPESFLATVTFTVYTLLILGGAGHTFGPIIGAMIYWTLITFTEQFLWELRSSEVIIADTLSDQDIAGIRFALMGLALMLLAAFRPQGILGRKEEAQLDEF